VTEKRAVLVAVDDEPENLDLVVRTMGALFDVHTFPGPREALAGIPALYPDVMLLDFRMPSLTGVELLRELRVLGVDAPALLVTGFADAREVRAAERDRLAFRIVAKPWRPAELRTAVQLAVNLHRMERAQQALKG